MKAIKIICPIVLAVTLFLYFNLSKRGSLVIDFLDVGQGDSILVQTPSGQNILVDCGPDNSFLTPLAEALPWWERTIDYLIISHYHADHYVGCPALLEKYKVKHLLVTGHQPDDYFYKIWQEELVKNELEPDIVKAGESFVFSDKLSWQILLADDYHEDYNENSLVFKLSYGNQDVLFMGDLGLPGEEKLLNSEFNLEAEILKVGHHGSRYASSPVFLEAVGPETCIIQSGLDNKHGHPHQEALDRLEQIGCEIKDNQDLGTIRVMIDQS